MNKKLKFFNTLGREYQEFQPIDDEEVRIYTCGPTVYNYAHIGNLRSYIFSDLLRRTLEFLGYQVKHVMNITDVGHLTDDADSGEDKMELQAKQKSINAWELADYYTKAFFRHTEMLNIKEPTIISKATDHIEEQIQMIQQLEKNGFIYKTSEAIYFDSSKFPNYGKLAKLNLEGLREGERVNFGEKRNKADFALWKFSSPESKRQMEWESPWGVGFPGWHIECSAMARKYLGDTFDIHTGGIDHIPVHHSNEIAQSESATGKSPYVKYWLHGEFLVLDKEEKMSKSKDNFLTLDRLIEEGFSPEDYRYMVLNAHYRSKLKFSFKNLEQAKNGFRKLKELILKLKKDNKRVELSEKALDFRSTFSLHLANDMDMPNVMATLWTMLKDKDLSSSEKYFLVLEFDQILGFGLDNFEESKVILNEEIKSLIQQRDWARAEKDWELADKTRLQLEQMGFIVKDSPSGTEVEKK